MRGLSTGCARRVVERKARFVLKNKDVVACLRSHNPFTLHDLERPFAHATLNVRARATQRPDKTAYRGTVTTFDKPSGPRVACGCAEPQLSCKKHSAPLTSPDLFGASTVPPHAAAPFPRRPGACAQIGPVAIARPTLVWLQEVAQPDG